MHTQVAPSGKHKYNLRLAFCLFFQISGILLLFHTRVWSKYW